MESPSLSYWQRIRNTEPATIRDPEQYAGGDAISIACTQTNLPASAQARLVQRWCELLPGLGNVKRLWLRSQVPQRLFDAITSMSGLTDLWIKWSSIKTIDALSQSQCLRNLHLGGSAQVQSLEALRTLRNLEWLTLENIKKVDRLDFIAGHAQLQGFGFSGGIWGKPELKTLDQIGALRQLTWLDLSSLRVIDGSLRPLAELKQLRFLSLPNYYAMKEYAFLLARLPALSDYLRSHDSLENLGIKCKRCTANYLVMLIGRGKKNLCPSCDKTALDAHCEQYRELVLQAAHGG